MLKPPAQGTTFVFIIVSNSVCVIYNNYISRQQLRSKAGFCIPRSWWKEKPFQDPPVECG